MGFNLQCCLQISLMRSMQPIASGRAAVGLVIGRSLFRFPRSACRSVLGQDTEPQKGSWCAGRHLAWQPPASLLNVCMNYCKSLWAKVSAVCSKCKCSYFKSSPYVLLNLTHVDLMPFIWKSNQIIARLITKWEDVFFYRFLQNAAVKTIQALSS